MQRLLLPFAEMSQGAGRIWSGRGGPGNDLLIVSARLTCVLND
jgi:hypothetical protein